jgi:predicted neuraminidase
MWLRFILLSLLFPLPGWSQDPASNLLHLRQQYFRDIGHPLDGRMRKEADGLRSAYLVPLFASSHAANLLSLRNGDLLCFWFSGHWEGDSGVAIVMSRLAAGSSGWSRPVVVDQSEGESYQNPVGFQSSDGVIWLFHTTQPAGKGESLSRVLVLQSRDNGKTWSRPKVLFDTPGSYLRNPALIGPAGDWLLPMYFTSAGNGGDTKTDHPAIAVSGDEGKSWKICEIPDANSRVQPSIFYDPGKGYVALLRSRRADHIYRSTSADGCHWTPPVATSLPNNNAAIQALRLPDGHILLAFNNTSAEMKDGRMRTGARKPLTLALSSDDGLTWSAFRDLEPGRSGVTDMSKVPGREEYSYPALALGHDGRIYVAYTFRRETIKVVSLPENWLTASVH